jgi:hypothetical protein
MVLWYRNVHDYQFDFETVTVAFFNKYPNPYASHVQSVDTLKREIKEDGKLYTTRLIKKNGKLPSWVKPFLGKISHSWIIEQTVIDPKTKEMKAYQRNLDHTKIIRVEEYTTYKFNDQTETTNVNYNVKFSSNFQTFGVKNRIEAWSHNRFKENTQNTTKGMAYVMARCQETIWKKKNIQV